MNPIIQWLQTLGVEARQGVIATLMIAIVFPVAMVVGSFGHESVWIAPLWSILLVLTLVVIIAAYSYLEHVIPHPVLYVVGAGIILVALMGATDTAVTDDTLYVAGPLRYVGTLVGAVFIIGTDLILAIAAWTGTFILVGVVAGLPGGLHFRDIPPTAKGSFEALAIIAFWLGLTGMIAALLTPRIPYELALILLLLAVIVIPGALVLAGRTSIKIAWGIMVALLLMGLTGAVVFALASLGVWEQIGVATQTHRVKFQFNAGFYTPDPIESVEVRAGDRIVFDAFGSVKEVGAPMPRSIRGNGQLLTHGEWYRQHGELMFRIAHYEAGALVSHPVLIEKFKTGPSAAMKGGPYAMGYHMSGEARVPQGVSGRLLIDFYRANVADAFVKLSVKILPEKSAAETLGKRILAKEKPLPDKQESRAILNIVGVVLLASILIGGGVAGWRAKEGLLFHLPTIVISAIIVVIALYTIQWFAYDNGGFTTLWKNFVALWKR